MIEGYQYIEIVKAYFGFLTEEFGFEVHEERLRGNVFYYVQYKSEKFVVNISYENIDDYLLVSIYLVQNMELHYYDDKIKTIYLSQLNAQVLSSIGRAAISLNNENFIKFIPENNLEKKLLKSAKELRLCLKHSAKLNYI